MKTLFAIVIVGFFAFTGTASSATFYIDYGCEANLDTACGDGTATSTPFSGLDEFVEVARNAGDIAYVRRGQASTTNITDLSPTSDGTLNAPIVLSADYDNLWSDFATSTQTYTPVPGTKTMTASASITGIAANDWIYISGDGVTASTADCNETYNNTSAPTCDFAYEVASVSGTTLTLYLPYLGSQTASGLFLRVMPDAPIWNITTGDFQLTMSGDHFWWIVGLHFRGTDNLCIVDLNNSMNSIAKDVISETDSATACGARGDIGSLFKKVRIFGGTSGFSPTTNAFGMNLQNVLIDCNNASGAVGVRQLLAGTFRMTDIEIVNCAGTGSSASLGLISVGTGGGGGVSFIRNIMFGNTYLTLSGASTHNFYFEDKFSVPGLNATVSTRASSATDATTTQSTTANLRSGGGPVNSLITPHSGNTNSGISMNNFPHSALKLFEYPIYTDTTSKTYTMYFNSTSTAAWTADPTASEFWIECEYYAVNSATNANRVIKKSTSIADFNGSTDWQGLSVTCAPAQAGILYLRGWYGKPKEAGSNWFYMDLQPTIS